MADNAATFTTTTNAIRDLSKTSDWRRSGMLGLDLDRSIDVHVPCRMCSIAGAGPSGALRGLHSLGHLGLTDIYSYANGGKNQPGAVACAWLWPSRKLRRSPSNRISRSPWLPTLPVESKGLLAANPMLPVEVALSVHGAVDAARRSKPLGQGRSGPPLAA